MWKIGDRVVIIQDGRRSLESFVGFKGTVNFVNRDGIDVVFDILSIGFSILNSSA